MLPNQLYNPNSEKPPFDIIFEQIKAGLVKRFSPGIAYRKPEFEHSTPNRMRIRLNQIKGSHYEICFRRSYYEFALHFESTPAMNLECCQAFDPYLREIADQVGQTIKSGPLENNGWMRIWYEQKHEPIDQVKLAQIIDQYSRFMGATFPILAKLYD